MKRFYRFPSPLLIKGFRFPSPILEQGSIGSSVQYWVKVVYVLKSNAGKRFLVPKSTTGKRFYRFPSPVLEKVLEVSQSSPGKRFYVFPRPILGKGFLGSPVQYWEKFFVPQTSTWIGSIGSPDQYL